MRDFSLADLNEATPRSTPRKMEIKYEEKNLIKVWAVAPIPAGVNISLINTPPTSEGDGRIRLPVCREVRCHRIRSIVQKMNLPAIESVLYLYPQGFKISLYVLSLLLQGEVHMLKG